MLIEFHIIQNFAPSCLNRDDTNTPKDCTFGGYRRARISSQCLKRTIRREAGFREALEGRLGVRTKGLIGEVARRLAQNGKDEAEARRVVEQVVTAAEYKVEDGNTSVLLYLSEAEISRVAEVVAEHYDAIVAGLAAVPSSPVPIEEGTKAKKSKKERAKGAQGSVPVECVSAVKELGATTEAADIALFGRMIAENKGMNIDAACQVAHAISTHEAAIEMDFFTAVDDLQPKEDTGAGMMGSIEFNSACFYRYAVVHLEQLTENLGGKRDIAREAVLAFAKAAVAAIPSGKQNSMAAHNPPSYVRVRVRDGGTPWSLANAFSRPIRVGREADDLAEKSVQCMEDFDRRLGEMYGTQTVKLDLASSIFPKHGGVALSRIWADLERVLS